LTGNFSTSLSNAAIDANQVATFALVPEPVTDLDR
jgi:hypothetical protein